MKAWVENNIIRDICKGNPLEHYHENIAPFYSTEVPEDAENGDSFIDGVLIKRPISPTSIATEVVTKPPTVSVIEYKMLFTSAERIATKISTDPVIMDLQELMNDPRTQNVDLSLESISEALDYMTSIGILAIGRKEQILLGKVR